MRRPLLWKSLAVFGIAVLLLIPLSLIEAQVSERRARHEQVVAEIAGSSAGSQHLTGPLLVLTYTAQVERETKSPEAGKGVVRTVVEEETHRVLVPEELAVEGRVQVDERHRGLYKTQVYSVDGALKGRFEIPPDHGVAARNLVALGRAYLVVGVSDLRGLGSRTRLQWDGAARDFAPGTPDNFPLMGIQVDLGPVAALAPGAHTFEVPLDLRGSQDFSIAPVAGRTDVKLGSNWGTPSFGGRFLPTLPPQVGPQGFEASWRISQLARNLDAALQPRSGEALQVSFIEPVNVYLKVDRATKYGLLFISLTFAAFFLFEVLKRLPVHPMQYGLVGVALAMFFLLLVSLSEHVPFHWAYVAASGACILLLGSYLVHVLRSRARGWGFAGGLTLLYGVLYGLLVSEDNALLMGSVLLFGALAAVMTATRRIDWYALGEEADRT